MPILNPKALVEARRKKGWTQVQLSEATKPQINVSTISRIERRGKPSRVRERTLKQWAVALGVNPKELCEAPNSEPDLVKLPMDTAARNALRLVEIRYGVSRRVIIGLAPLLFYTAAERSLAARQKFVEELRDAANSLESLQRQMPHLPSIYGADAEALRVELESIEARDLFGRRFANQSVFGERGEDYDEDQHNPFAAFLNEALNAVRRSDHPDKDFGAVQCAASFAPTYGICHDEAAEIVGGDEEAAVAIVHGRVALHEMPKGTPAERAEWVGAKLAPPDVDFGDLDGVDF